MYNDLDFDTLNFFLLQSAASVSLTSLTFNDYNQIFYVEKSSNNLNQINFPLNLTQLNFPDSFTEYIKELKLPSKLKIINLGANFVRNLFECSFPDSVEEIWLSNMYKESVES